MGVRQALGAARGDILRLVLRQGLWLSLAGMGVGLLGAVGLTRVLTSLVPSVQPGDPVTLAAVSALLIGVALAATFLPAQRAARVDPLVALRYE
jgi:putative ABC transport system permease protein